MSNSKHMKGHIKDPSKPFLKLEIDDKRKQEHHKVLAYLLEIFQKTGMNHYNISHIDDPKRDKNLPIKQGDHLFDLSFPVSNDTIALIELKILKLPKKPKKK